MQPLRLKETDSETLNRLAENERHFHNIQAGIRGLASTWMLAAFAYSYSKRAMLSGYFNRSI
jgi:hypothetical protein